MKLTCSIDEIRRLSAEEVKEILDKDMSGEFQLVDVRQPYEYEAGHIPGAKWIPLGEIEYRHAELERDKKIITYCRSGHRSMAANTLLCGLGFKNIYNLDGGILNWHHDVVKGIPEERPELITGKEDVGDILMLALKLENGAVDFYSKTQEKVRDKKDFYKRVAGLVGDSETRSMLHELAGEERNHINALLQQIEEPKGGCQQ